MRIEYPEVVHGVFPEVIDNAEYLRLGEDLSRI